MSDPLNPQSSQMADESMVRTLAAQAEAIWPQEEPLFRRYGLPGEASILDAGCGTGEITARLAGVFPRARLLGVDVEEGHLNRARARCAGFEGRARFENRSVFDLGLPGASFDLVVCRHVVHAIPHPERVVAELARVAKRGGRLHVIAEDYGMIHFPERRLDPDDFWRDGPVQFGASTGTDLRIGRGMYGVFRRAGLREIAIDYVIVDTLRVPRETFVAIWQAWRDGYVDAVAQHTSFGRDEVAAHFEDQIATLRDGDAYAVWMVPVVSGLVP